MENVTKLMGVGELIKKSIDMTLQKAKTLYAISALTYAAWLGFGLIAALIVGGGIALKNVAGSVATGVTGGVLGVVLFVVFIIIAIWIQCALLSAVINEYNFSEAFRSTKGKLGKFFGTSILVVLITLLGFILLIVPGIIFSIWYTFAPMIVIAEGLSGMDALRKSKSYVKGRWWATVGRMLAVGVIIWLVQVVIQLILSVALSDEVASIAGMIVAFIFTPFGVVFQYLLYKNLKDTSMGQPATPVVETNGQLS